MLKTETSSTSDSTFKNIPKKANIQSRLTKAVSAVIFVILFFMLLTIVTYKNIESFINVTLPKNLSIARTYERLASQWTSIAEKTSEYLNNFENSPKYDDVSPLTLNTHISKLSDLIDDPLYSCHIITLKELCASFTRQLSDFNEQITIRNAQLKQKTTQRIDAACHLRTEVLLLLSQFKSMMSDLKKTFLSSDSDIALSQTSSLIDKISKIEQDLSQAETEITLYLSLRGGENTTITDPHIGQKTAIKIENRLNAISHLIDNSLRETRSTVQKRVLAQVDDKIKSFKSSFSRLRNILEAPSDSYEITEHNINELFVSMMSIKQLATTIAVEQAEDFWNKIENVSNEIQTNADYNNKIILFFLALSFFAGLYLKKNLPKKLGAPLGLLNQQINDFKLGSEIPKIINSGTEEIDSISSAFFQMSQRLNYQAEINQKYLESVYNQAKVFRELHESKRQIESPGESVEKAINLIIQQLIAHCPGIDLVKVLVIESQVKILKNKKKTTNRVFIRKGDTEFSDKFKNSSEAKPYFDSVGYDPDNPSDSATESFPIECGLSGWYYENFPGINLGNQDSNFFQPIYRPQPICNNPILINREYEKGLNGALVTELLSVPSFDSEESTQDQGILFVYYLDPNIKLSWQELCFIKIIAAQIASVIETDALLRAREQKKEMDMELKTAREVQENLLPKSVPLLDGIKIDKISKTAAEVGGDYYDFFILKDKRIGVIIADATGKNVSAAIIMTVFKTTLSTMDLDSLPASKVLSKANKIFTKNISEAQFLTAIYVILDPTNGNVEYVSAGHNPSFIVSGYGMDLALHQKDVKCPPLGVYDDFEYESISFSLKPGDMLFLYTDGVTEARNHLGEEFGLTGLKKYLAKPKRLKPAQALLQELEEFTTGTSQHDDITAISVEYTGRKP